VEARTEAHEKLEEATVAAIKTLVAELRADASNDRIRAAVAILDRVLGRPRQTHEHDVRVERDWDRIAQEAHEKLDHLLRNKARRLADENGEGA
jgi:hypothetical protein